MSSRYPQSYTQAFARLLSLSALCAFLACAAMLGFAFSPQGTPRKIVSDDFTNNRPTTDSKKGTASPSGGVAPPRPPRKQRVYNLASTSAIGPRPPRSKPKPGSKSVIAQIGITVWRLRRVTTNESVTRQIAREKGEYSAWTRERIQANTLIRKDDRMRFSIESPVDGYLYVVNRDELSDGSIGAINLIFPLAGEDNRVSAGRLVEIPEPDAKPMRANPAPNQTGEVLSIIVSDTPLNLPLSDDVLPIKHSQLQEWERAWGGATEHWEMEGGAGETWTVAEQQAAAKKGTRQLTRDDPPPQTIYRVSTTDTKAMLVNVRLKYAK